LKATYAYASNIELLHLRIGNEKLTLKPVDKITNQVIDSYSHFRAYRTFVISREIAEKIVASGDVILKMDFLSNEYAECVVKPVYQEGADANLEFHFVPMLRKLLEMTKAGT
jgi:hypothetical protein